MMGDLSQSFGRVNVEAILIICFKWQMKDQQASIDRHRAYRQPRETYQYNWTEEV